MSSTLEINNQVLSVAGDITFSNVQALYIELVSLVEKGARESAFMFNTVDFSNVERVDTAALAFCLKIEKSKLDAAAQSDAKKVKYVNVPSAMLAIAESVGVCSLFK